MYPMASPGRRNPCRYFIHGGSCTYGDECKFAHVRDQQHGSSDPKPDMAGVSGSTGFSQVGGYGENFDRFQQGPSGNQSGPGGMNPYGGGGGGGYGGPPREMGPGAGGPYMDGSGQDMNGIYMPPNPSDMGPQYGAPPDPQSYQRGEFVPMMNDSMQMAGGLSGPMNALSIGGAATDRSVINPGASEFFPKGTSALPSHHMGAGGGRGPGGDLSGEGPKMYGGGMGRGYHGKSQGMPPRAGQLSHGGHEGPPATAQPPPMQVSAPVDYTIQENVGGTTFFYNQDNYESGQLRQVYPAYSSFASVPPHVAHFKPKPHQPSFFVRDDLKMHLLDKIATTNSQVEGATGVPEEVDSYHQLVPLESPADNKGNPGMMPAVSTCYKAVNVKDGMVYCLRRLHSMKLNSAKCMSVVAEWKKISHTNIVSLREFFTTKAFGDHSMVFVYDYHPKSITLSDAHFAGNQPPSRNNAMMPPFGMEGQGPGNRPYGAGSKGSAGGSGPRDVVLLPEGTIWTYIVQLSNALRCVHAAGLAAHLVNPSKILLTDRGRVRLNCCGLYDVVKFDPNNPVPSQKVQQYQQADLESFGRCVLSLACNSLQCDVQTAIETVRRSFSADLHNLIMYFLSNHHPRPKTINDIMPMIGARFYGQLEAAEARTDAVESELIKELEASRVLRLLAKLNSILERPEHRGDPAWSEVGDRYILKLLRTYIFHAVDEHGQPWMDMAHVITCLNKLDAGVNDKVRLCSQDGQQSVLIVTYAELKKFLAKAYGELLSGGSAGDM